MTAPAQPEPAALNRAAARERLAEKRSRIRVLADIRNVHAAAAAADSAELRGLLNAIAHEMDDFIASYPECTPDEDDMPVWKAAAAVARALLGGQP